MTILEVYFSFSGLFNALTSTLLGFLIYRQKRKNKTGNVFVLFCICVAVWSYPYIFWPLAKTKEETLFWFQLLHIGPFYASIAYLHFVSKWLDLYKNKIKKVVLLGYLIATFLVPFVFTDLFIKEMVPNFSMRFWAEPGVLYHFYLILFFGFAFFSSYLLIKAYNKASGVKREQIKYLLFGMVLAYIGGSTNYFLWYDINIPPYGNILASSYVIFSAYAMVKHRFLDVKIILKKSFIYFLIAIFVYATYHLILYTQNHIFGSSYKSGALITGVFYAIAFVWLFQLLEDRIKKFANKYFYRSYTSYEKTIGKLTAKLNTLIDPNEIVKLIIDAMLNSLKAERAGILMSEDITGSISDKRKYQIIKTIGFNEQNGINLVKTSFLTDYLGKEQNALVAGEITSMIEASQAVAVKNDLKKLKEQMDKIKAGVCLPLIFNNKLVGIIVLGNKVNKEAFTIEEINLLETMSGQAAVALVNAMLYDEMEVLVLQRTKQLELKNVEIDRKNMHLKEVLEQRKHFLHIANHQLRTPFTAIAGSMELALDETFSKEDRENFLKDAWENVGRMRRVISDILKANDIIGSNIEIKKKEFDIVKAAKGLVSEMDDRIDKKGLKLELKASEDKIVINQDESKVEQVLSNLIDNSIHYTEKGSIKIDIQKNNSKIKIKIADTGIGMTKEFIDKKLFGQFSRGENAQIMRPDGSGIGLFVIKSYVKAMGGKIWAESEGVGKGSRFFVEIPTASA